MTTAETNSASVVKYKPGWCSRVFGIEVGKLAAFDAHWDGTDWHREDDAPFLYRSQRGKFFVLRGTRDWRIATDDEAQRLYETLPHKLMTQEELYSEPTFEPIDDGDEDPRTYIVVRNGTWDFSVWLEKRELPSGWTPVGFSGLKHECLDYVRRYVVFGAPNPGMEESA